MQKINQVFSVIILCAFTVVACQSAPDEATPTAVSTPTAGPKAPRNENVEALNEAQAALSKQDFGFAPLLLKDEARIGLETISDVETPRLMYPQQPDNPALWETVDSFVSAYATRRLLSDQSQVLRLALGRINVSASIDNMADIVPHMAIWVTFIDGSQAVIDLTPLATNFAPRHVPERLFLDGNELDLIFQTRRSSLDMDRLQPLTIVEQDDQPYFVLAKILVSYDRYVFALHVYPVEPADPITLLKIRPGVVAEVEINRSEFEALQTLVLDHDPTLFIDQPQLLTRRGSEDETLNAVLDDNFYLLWHLIAKFEHQLPDPAIATPTPTITQTPLPTSTPTPTPTPRTLPLVTS